MVDQSGSPVLDTNGNTVKPTQAIGISQTAQKAVLDQIVGKVFDSQGNQVTSA